MNDVYKNSVEIWVNAVCNKDAISTPVIMQLIKDLTKERKTLLLINNFFAIADKNGKFKRYSTPVHGLRAGVDLITNNPQFAALKIGTLKANQKLQLQKIRAMLGIQA